MDLLLLKMFEGMDGDAKNPGSRIATHLPMLHLLAREHAWAPIVECGVGRGWSTTALLSGAIAGGGKLYSYDKNKGTKEAAIKSMGLAQNDPILDRWKFTAKGSLEAPGEWAAASVGMFFLDTNHDYDSTLQELTLWSPKIHPKGLMCGHDYFLHLRWGPSSGVDRAVATFQKNFPGRYKLQIFPNDDGLFILWPAQS